MLDRLTAAAAVALGWRTAFSPDLMSSLNIQMDTPRNCTMQDGYLSARHHRMCTAMLCTDCRHAALSLKVFDLRSILIR